MDEREKSSLFARHRENIYFRWGLTAFLVIVACVIVAQVVFQISSVIAFFGRLLRTLSPVLYGLGIAYLLDPIVGRVQVFLQPRLEKRFPGKARGLARGLGILAAMAVMLLLVWALLSMILPELLSSVNTIVGNMSGYYSTLESWVMRLMSNSPEISSYVQSAMDSAYDYIRNLLTPENLTKLQNMLAGLTSSVVRMAKVLLNLIIGLIISVYLLVGKEKFLSQAKKLTYALLGVKRAGYVCNVCTFANRTFGGFIGGKIVDSLIIGVLCFIGLSLLKMPYTLLISIIVGVTNIIPFFGPYLGAVPSAVLLLVIDPVKCLTFVIFILILQQLDGNVIGPMILGDATGLSGFWVVVSILVFGSFWGVAGMILAVPTFAVIYQIIAEITNRLIRRRGLSTDTTDYTRWNYPPRPEADHWQKPRKSKLRRPLGRRKAAETQSAEPESSDPPENPT